MENRVTAYWTKRAKDFNTVRRNELRDPITRRWQEAILPYLPEGQLDILDVGTGTGYFAVLLTELGHRVTGIDLTPAMLNAARQNCAELGVSAEFLEMDAQKLAFADETFDVVISRNLTWTLPDPEKAYGEWFRVLKPGGVLLNFDADYAANVRNENQRASYIRPDEAYGHCGVTRELEAENAAITLSMPASRLSRPDWDMAVLERIGFTRTGAERDAGSRILQAHNLTDAPMFLVWGRKGENYGTKNLG